MKSVKADIFLSSVHYNRNEEDSVSEWLWRLVNVLIHQTVGEDRQEMATKRRKQMMKGCIQKSRRYWDWWQPLGTSRGKTGASFKIPPKGQDTALWLCTSVFQNWDGTHLSHLIWNTLLQQHQESQHRWLDCPPLPITLFPVPEVSSWVFRPPWTLDPS